MFEVGKPVVWTKRHGASFDDDVVMRLSSIKALDPDAVLGIVTSIENETHTHIGVLVDGEEEPRVLTNEELVMVKEG